MLFQITHSTHYSYQSPVSHSLNELRLTPRPLDVQEVRSAEIDVQPQPTFLHHRNDYYGNDVTSFELFERHDHLDVKAQSVVEVRSQKPGVLPAISWEEARQQLNGGELEFIYFSPYVPSVPQVNDYARKTFVTGRSMLEAVKELTHRIHADFKYLPQSTSIDVPLREVMRQRRGVCQDFAHVMIGALRSQRLAARYVSGYVRPGPKVQGAQASHAWVSVFFPGTGWLSFDPTNDLMVSDTHVTLAWGRDYGDVTPVKGVSLGGGGQTVSVEVFVKPIET